MALLGLDRLTKKDLFTAETWNNMVAILEAKFSGGVSDSDLTWPLVAQDNIDFDQQYGIVGLRSFWNIVLCDGASGGNGYATLDSALTAVAATGGGAIFIPPYTTVSANAASIATSNVTIFGAGPTSVIKITASATGPMIDTATTGLSNIRLANLTLDGTGGGAGCIGVRVRKVAQFQMLNVYMTAFTGDFIYITNDGTAGQASTDAYLQNVHCSGGSDSHLVCDDISGLTVVGFTSKTATGDAISMVPAGATNLIQDVTLSAVRIQSGGDKGIRIIGSGATGIDAHSRIHLSDCHAVSMTDVPFELGNTATLLKDVTVEHCFAPDAAGDAIRVASNRGLVMGCAVPGAGGKGINAQNSVDVLVSGNHCQDATGDGVDADSTTDCTVIHNNVRDCGDGVSRASATGLRIHGNVGDNGPTIGHVYTDSQSDAVGTGTGTFAQTYTVPANTLRDGDRMRITLGVTSTGTTDTVAVQLGGNTIYTSGSVTAVQSAITIDVVVRQDPNTTASIGTMVRNAGTVNANLGSATSIDLTADLAITVSKLGTSDTITLNRFYVELLGAVE